MQGPVRAVAIDSLGRHMATAGADGEVKVWDIRTFKTLHTYFSHVPATSLDISQRGLLAVGARSKVQVRHPVMISIAQPTCGFRKVLLIRVADVLVT